MGLELARKFEKELNSLESKLLEKGVPPGVARRSKEFAVHYAQGIAKFGVPEEAIIDDAIRFAETWAVRLTEAIKV
jgi:hypothetical protein